LVIFQKSQKVLKNAISFNTNDRTFQIDVPNLRTRKFNSFLELLNSNELKLVDMGVENSIHGNRNIIIANYYKDYSPETAIAENDQLITSNTVDKLNENIISNLTQRELKTEITQQKKQEINNLKSKAKIYFWKGLLFKSWSLEKEMEISVIGSEIFFSLASNEVKTFFVSDIINIKHHVDWKNSIIIDINVKVANANNIPNLIMFQFATANIASDWEHKLNSELQSTKNTL